MKYQNLLFGLIIGIVLLCVFNSSDSIENFYCPNCNRNNWTGESECANCHNCGWCIDPNGYGSCGIGDGRGPFFKECRSWFYRGMKMYGSDPSISQSIRPMYVVSTPWYNLYGWFRGHRHGNRRRHG